MRRTLLALMALGLLGAGIDPAHAVTGTCTVTVARAPVANFGLTFPLPDVTGVAFGVEFDETAGTFSFSRDAFAAKFGPEGAIFPTGFGPNGWIVMPPGSVTGTIDGNGNVVLRRVAMAFATDFCPPRTPDYPIQPDLSTMTQFRIANNASYARVGTPMDASGSLTLDGVDLIPDACGAGGPTLSGVRITCQLSPVPNLAGLPTPALEKVTGTAKIGPELPTTPPAKPAKGDTLQLKGNLVDWAQPLNLAGDDVFLRLQVGSDPTVEDVVILRVPAGRFQTKGKKSKVVDKDGSLIEVMVGQKKNDTVDAATGGNIVLASGKKGVKVTLRVQGLDLAKLTGSAGLVLAVGPYSSTATVSASGSGNKRKLRQL